MLLNNSELTIQSNYVVNEKHHDHTRYDMLVANYTQIFKDKQTFQIDVQAQCFPLLVRAISLQNHMLIFK